MSPQLSDTSMKKLEDSKLLHNDCLIDGEWIVANDGTSFPVIDPATGKTLGHVPDMGVEETHEAICAAHRAFEKWKNTTYIERYQLMKRWAKAIEEHANDLALILTLENGKPLEQALSEVNDSCNYIHWYAEESKRIYGNVLPAPLPNQRFMTVKQPVGVCSVITPWNFPNSMITRKIGAAIAAGCTVVIKPAPDTPFSALALADLADRVGIPRGVVNVVTTQRHVEAVGKEMCTHDLVRKVSFTGSTAVGKRIMKLCAEGVKRISLELGGNAPFIVFDDADIEKAVDELMAIKILNAGQVCVAPNRIYVQSSVYDRFVDMVADRMRSLEIGSGLDENVHVGPLINAGAREKVHRHLEDAVKHGARVVVGSEKPKPGAGFFMQPTLLSDLSDEAMVNAEETFGPLLAMRRFQTEEEVIRLANNTKHGLASYVFTRDVGRVFRMSEALESGMVSVNSSASLLAETLPFGGVKESGIGREGSKYGIESYVDDKLVAISF